MVLDWNGGEETLGCLERLHAVTRPLLEVILVDNGSHRSVVDEVLRRFPGVATIRNHANLGYAGGNNVGIRAALARGADYVLVLNNDARVELDAIAAMLAIAAEDSRIAAVGARILAADDPTRLAMAYGELTYRQSLVRLVGEGERNGPLYDRQRDVDWVSGCAILLVRRALEEIGLFDEDLFAYHEEVDWCARARARGLRVVYAPGAAVVHRGEASSGGRSYVSRKQYLAARNMVLFVRRHGTRGERLRFAAWVIATLPFQYLRRLATGEQHGVVLKVRGMLDALRGRPIPRAELGLD